MKRKENIYFTLAILVLVVGTIFKDTPYIFAVLLLPWAFFMSAGFFSTYRRIVSDKQMSSRDER